MYKWVPEVNTFDSTTGDFDGWTLSRGCHSIVGVVIGESCGGLAEIHPSTSAFSNLFEVIIKVKPPEQPTYHTLLTTFG